MRTRDEHRAKAEQLLADVEARLDYDRPWVDYPQGPRDVYRSNARAVLAALHEAGLSPRAVLLRAAAAIEDELAGNPLAALLGERYAKGAAFAVEALRRMAATEADHV